MKTTITWDQFTELLSEVHALDVDGMVVDSPLDEDDEVTIVHHDEGYDTKEITFARKDNNVIGIVNHVLGVMSTEGTVYKVIPLVQYTFNC